MKKILIIIVLLVVLAGGIAGWLLKKPVGSNPLNSNSAVTNSNQSNSTTPAESNGNSTISNSNNSNTAITAPKSSLADPVADFRARVTKKPFGIYITPQNSPVQPERFTGYHAGADAEYQDISSDVPVYAVADGTVVLSETASGYGGVFMIEITLNGAKHTVLYGHIRPSSLPKVGQKVVRGQQIALLGTGYSSETDGERRHLHFAILAGNSLNIKGYVSTKSQLVSWLDPLNYF